VHFLRRKRLAGEDGGEGDDCGGFDSSLVKSRPSFVPKITPRRSIRAFELLKYQTAGASGRLHTLPARNPRWRERRISLFEHRRQETQENAVIPQHSPGSDRRKSKECWGLFKN
jgi:hypothetical protein